MASKNFSGGGGENIPVASLPQVRQWCTRVAVLTCFNDIRCTRISIRIRFHRAIQPVSVRLAFKCTLLDFDYDAELYTL
jgi:hypothetical protein